MNEFYPNSFDFKLATEKGLANNNELTEKFEMLEKKYRKYLQIYMCNMLNLTDYDEKIKESELNFVPCQEELKDYYQKQSNLKYMYIKNNMHIEKLTQEDMNLLATSSNDNELLQLVARTFLEVIKIEVIDGKYIPGKFQTQYFKGYDTMATILPNDSVIIVIKEGHEKTNFNNLEELRSSLQEKDKFINQLITDMKTSFKNVDFNVEIIHLLV